MYLNAPVSWLITGAVAALPVVLMVSNDGASILFYLLVGVTVFALLGRRFQPGPGFSFRDWRVLIVAMLGVLLAVFASQAWHGQLRGSGIERAGRFAFMILFVWLFSQVDPGRFRHIQWGMVASAILSGCLLIFPLAVTGTRPDTVAYTPYNTVSFSNLTLLFAVSCLFLVFGPALTRWPTAERVLKLAAGGIGLYGFLLSQTRSGWLALPVFALIAVLLYHKVSLRVRIATLLAVLAVATVLGGTSGDLGDRVRSGFVQWEACQSDSLADTSVCIRVQLAKAAWHMFRESPVFGIGDANFRQSLQDLAKEGVVSPYVAKSFGETHNDILFILARYGILGVLSLLAIYLVPAWYFIRSVAKPDCDNRAYAAMGLSCCLGFAVFGLTELMFRGMRTVGFYSVWVGAMLVLGLARRAGCQPAIQRI